MERTGKNTTNKQSFLAKIKNRGLFTLQEAKRYGVSQSTLSRLVKENLIQRVARGQYVHAECDIDIENIDFAITCKKFGKTAVIGGLTALAHYNLADEIPNRIWVLVKADVRTKESIYRCIRTTINLNHGVVNMGKYRISNIERAIIEGFKFSSKIGLGIVLKAARRALSTRQTTESKLVAQAKRLNLEKYLLKYWEVISPEANPF